MDVDDGDPPGEEVPGLQEIFDGIDATAQLLNSNGLHEVAEQLEELFDEEFEHYIDYTDRGAVLSPGVRDLLHIMSHYAGYISGRSKVEEAFIKLRERLWLN